MSLFNSLQNAMENVIGPIAEKISRNKTITAMQNGMMMSMPISIGMAVVAIVANFPITAWTDFLTSIGLSSVLQCTIMATGNILALYLVFVIAYNYGKNEGENGVTAAILSMAVFLILMPQYITVGEEYVAAFALSNMGSDGMFVGLMVSILVPKFYCWLMSKNIKLKLPSSVPPMVTDSLSPIFTSMIIFTSAAFIKYGFSLTSYGTIFVWFNTIIGTPIMKFGASPWALLGVYTISNLFWFFGIHPSAIQSIYVPVVTAVGMECGAAFVAGTPLDKNNVIFMILYLACTAGGTGNTLGMAIQGCFAKSEQYRSVSRVAVVPNLFNINEPMIFGYPIMLNPIFFFPLLLSSLVPGVILIIVMNVLPTIGYNPTVQLPWVTPTVISGFIQGGLMECLMILLSQVIGWLIYLPFFKIADAQAYKQEQEAKAAQAAQEEEPQLVLDSAQAI